MSCNIDRHSASTVVAFEPNAADMDYLGSHTITGSARSPLDHHTRGLIAAVFILPTLSYATDISCLCNLPITSVEHSNLPQKPNTCKVKMTVLIFEQPNLNFPSFEQRRAPVASSFPGVTIGSTARGTLLRRASGDGDYLACIRPALAADGTRQVR